MSGLLVRQVRPLALMLCAERVPIERPHLKCVDPNGFSRSPETTVSVLRRHALANSWSDLPAAYAASNSAGSLYLSPRTMIAQAIRAILLAKATAATLVGRRAINWPSHGCFLVPCFCA